MTAVTFDTLRYAAALKAAGVPDAHAQAQAEALADALRQASQDLATKADIAELRMAMKIDIAELDARIQAMLNQLQVMIGVMVALTAIYAAIVKLL
jgi:hypothetical protein